MKIKKGDNVMMLSGKDRGKTGKVLNVDAAAGRVIVEGLNTVKRHVRARKQGQKGQVITKERFVSASAVAVVCKGCGKPTRIKIHMLEKGKIRVCKRCTAEL